ncbi:MAG: carbamoyltransferase HypF [Cyclobacteriaceae bacterium]|nr:carbamoyltransferase HypF [Cyclobacteriaceae bacterium]
MATRRLHIEGLVQGVGFRPYVYRLANRHSLTGWVNNNVGGVDIEVSGSTTQLDSFQKELCTKPPVHARISAITAQEVPSRIFDSFEITESQSEGLPKVLLTPDLGLCDDCRKELSQPGNRRFGYPFTTCLKCGPRYSIITGLPYDRPLTTMARFTMCPDCEKEFRSPAHRRFYSQTNSCPQCAVTLSLVASTGQMLTSKAAHVIEQAVEWLRQGKIIAVKGIGGYLLVTDAGNADSVALLRERKHRPSKPFALLMNSVEEARHYVHISDPEAEALQSLECPVVLLQRKNHTSLPGVAPGLDRLGIMLPSAPLLALLTDAFRGPLVATSGNISGSPIFYSDKKAIENLGHIADGFLIHDRDIVVPQDDSVVQFTTHGRERIVLRRSRGMAPLIFSHPFRFDSPVLAMGADMKSAFALYTRGNLYASQYLGDLENYDTQAEYRHTLDHLLRLLNTAPSTVVTDLHPGYFSTQTGKQLSDAWKAEHREIQHHKAHFGAVLAENDRIASTDPVLGVIWDGTGLGEDRHVWGGEFFRYEDYRMERVDHLGYFQHILGDKFSREPRLCALSLAKDHPEAIALLQDKFTDDEWKLYRSMLQQPGLMTSSVGRLFDGVASLLGLCDHSTYEGEAALFLENCALRAHNRFLEPIPEFTTDKITDYVIRHLLQGSSRSAIAYQFHVGLVHWIAEIARQQKCRTLAFSGGVFQNALLNDLLTGLLADEFELLFHQELSPNDECIGYGQLACLQVEKLHQSFHQQIVQSCVLPSPVN